MSAIVRTVCEYYTCCSNVSPRFYIFEINFGYTFSGFAIIFSSIGSIEGEEKLNSDGNPKGFFLLLSSPRPFQLTRNNDTLENYVYEESSLFENVEDILNRLPRASRRSQYRHSTKVFTLKPAPFLLPPFEFDQNTLAKGNKPFIISVPFAKSDKVQPTTIANDMTLENRLVSKVSSPSLILVPPIFDTYDSTTTESQEIKQKKNRASVTLDKENIKYFGDFIKSEEPNQNSQIISSTTPSYSKTSSSPEYNQQFFSTSSQAYSSTSSPEYSQSFDSFSKSNQREREAHSTSEPVYSQSVTSTPNYSQSKSSHLYSNSITTTPSLQYSQSFSATPSPQYSHSFPSTQSPPQYSQSFTTPHSSQYSQSFTNPENSQSIATSHSPQNSQLFSTTPSPQYSQSFSTTPSQYSQSLGTTVSPQYNRVFPSSSPQYSHTFGSTSTPEFSESFISSSSQQFSQSFGSTILPKYSQVFVPSASPKYNQYPSSTPSVAREIYTTSSRPRSSKKHSHRHKNAKFGRAYNLTSNNFVRNHYKYEEVKPTVTTPLSSFNWFDNFTDFTSQYNYDKNEYDYSKNDYDTSYDGFKSSEDYDPTSKLLSSEIASLGMKVVASKKGTEMVRKKWSTNVYTTSPTYNSQKTNKSKQQKSESLQLSASETGDYRRKYTNNYNRPRSQPRNRGGDILRALASKSDNPIPGVAGVDYPTLSRPPSSPIKPCSSGVGYVADITSGCQAFYICVGNGVGEPLLCPNGTLFSQDFLVCDWWYNVECQR